MPSVTVAPAVTLALACASATFFLFLRCEGKGRPFGPSSRRWAVLAIGSTSLLSTGLALSFVYLLHLLPEAFLGVGIAAPSWLWLGEIRKGSEDRRNLVRDMSTLWLTRLLARMHEGMAEDRLRWSEERVDPMWSTGELNIAARYYHRYLHERLSTDARRRSRIKARLGAIEARLTVSQLIESGGGRTKVAAALQGSRVTKEPRYTRSVDDPGRLADVLRHDAREDLVRMLGYAYTEGFHKLPAYHPVGALTHV